MDQVPHLAVRRIEQMLPRRRRRVNDSGNIYLCRYCNQMFGKKFKKTIHEKTCSRNENIEKSLLHSLYYCDQCGSNFKQIKSLNRHRFYDCGIIHKCEKCNKIFGTQRNLKCHIQKCYAAVENG